MFKIQELIKAAGAKWISGPQGSVVKGFSTDTRTMKKGEAFITIKNKRDGREFIPQAIAKGSRCIIFSGSPPKISSNKVTLLKVKGTLRALGDIAAFHRRRFNIPVVAITGSNGKTTTKDMLSWVLSSKFRVLKNEGTLNNLIGLPHTLLKLRDDHDLAVVEIGTNHFGEVSRLAQICAPNIGVITCIGQAHLEYFGDLKGVLREKISLIKNLQKPNIGILNADDPNLVKEINRKSKKPFILGFSINRQSDFSARGVRFNKDTFEFFVNSSVASAGRKIKLATLGRHNLYNAMATVSVARLLGLNYQEISRKLASFDFPYGRFKLINVKDVAFIDDTYNSNPFSLERALEALSSFKTKGRRIVVMGDMLELGAQGDSFHRIAGRLISRSCNAFIGVGRLSRIAAESAQRNGFNKRGIFVCDSSKEARKILEDKISPNSDDIVLVKGSRMMKMEEVFRV